MKRALLILALLLTASRCKPSAVENDMDETATPGHLLTSPNGKYRLVVFDDDESDSPVRGFRLEDSEGRRLLEPAERWSVRHRLYFLWDQQERVWVYSGDVGTTIWELGEAGWQPRPFAGSGLRAPELLRRTVPKLFEGAAR